MEATQTITPQLNDSVIVNNAAQSFIFGTIVEVREKAIKIDYEVTPVWGSGKTIIYTAATWLPIKGLEADGSGCWKAKKWLERSFKGGHRIKPYFIAEGGRKVLC